MEKISNILFPILKHNDKVEFTFGEEGILSGRIVKRLFPGYNCKYSGTGRMRYVIQDPKDRKHNWIVHENQIVKVNGREFERNSRSQAGGKREEHN